MPLHLYNSLSRDKERFTPLSPDRVTMYVCGPTAYNPPHIGNARAAVVYDLLYRVLKRHYRTVIYARNITDVDDKINAAARAEGVPIETITARYIEIYHRDMQCLGVLSPDIEPRATDHIGPMIAMIERLVDTGFAYVAQAHVLFQVAAYERYGELSGRVLEDMIAGARVEIATFKRDPADFVLWKPSNDDVPGWDSPWGWGRPGWHIECSAMAEQHLGDTIDIHGGGNDLKFPHHENEIAQSVCSHGGTGFARYWVHNGFVEIDSEKMSKSLGNVLLVEDLLQNHAGEAIRLALINSRYREPLHWADGIVEQAKAQLDRLYGALHRLESVNLGAMPRASAAFYAAMDDDLNSALAISHLMESVTRANTAHSTAEQIQAKSELLGGGAELGIMQQSPAEWFAGDPSGDIDIEKVNALVAERDIARLQKDWNRADEIRDELAAMRIQIQDGPTGTEWRT
ncbi:MAG: cysteine--tRNA ligase [Proteobacteria bacterium]|nr:MAG: cysteine--tRNA ligase [Pseudomonadota bacterium]